MIPDCLFKQHITAITKKISTAVGVIYKLRHFVTRKILQMTYYSVIYPFLIYAIPIWGSSNATDLQTILVMQKKAVRLLTFNDVYPVEAGPLIQSAPLFKELGILTINDIFQLLTAKFVHDCINLNCPSQFQNYFFVPDYYL